MKPIINVASIRTDFPILKRKINGKSLVYLDNAATSQKPLPVIEAIVKYYAHYNANVHRGIHTLSMEASEGYDQAHQIIAEFINANDWREIIFTRNTTEGLNLIANGLKDKLKEGDEILLSEMEHHSNIVPWQQIAKAKKAKLKFLKLKKDGTLDIDAKLFTPKTKIVSITHISNVLGTVNDVKKIAGLAHMAGALMVVDAAQSAPHMKINVQDFDCDFMLFSSHKMLGPTGIGVVYGKKKLLEAMPPFLYGGDMIREVSLDDARWNDLPWKFEAGTPNIADAIGFVAAIEYLNEVGMEKIHEYENELMKYAMKKIKEVPGIEIYGPSERGSLISFNLKGIHAHDVASILDHEGIAIRGGHHCAMPLTKILGIEASCRASFYFYNNRDEVDRLVDGLKKVVKVFAK